MKAISAAIAATAHQCPYCDKRFAASYDIEPSQIECCGEVGHVTPAPHPFTPILLKKLHAHLRATGESVSKIRPYDYGADEDGHTFNWTTPYPPDTLLGETAVNAELKRTLTELVNAVECRSINTQASYCIGHSLHQRPRLDVAGRPKTR